MPYFAMPYRVLFHDTMAYGSHHHTSNFTFQNIARETILFESKLSGKTVWEEQLKDLILLTREAYSLNLAPVTLGQKVAILLSYEDPTRSTVRLCFRIVREDGQPVSCGYQTMICMHKDTQKLVPAPRMITQYLDSTAEYSLIEKLTDPSFGDRLKKGATVKEVFTEEVIELGKYVANTKNGESRPRILDERLREYGMEVQSGLPASRHGIVFTFPGQGSYNPAVLRALYEGFPETIPCFHHADDVAKSLLGQEFLSVILAPKSVHDHLLTENRDAPQIGIYLAGALIARILLNRGVEPELLLGHSVGELAALATAGVYSIEAGTEIVCRRVLALRGAGVSGQMAAISRDAQSAAELLLQFGPRSLEIAVVNHPKQTVLSGSSEDIAHFGDFLSGHGVGLTPLASPFPFHSSWLTPAVEPFREALSRFQFQAARISVFHCTEGMVWSPDRDLTGVLSAQFVRKLDFARILSQVHQQGFRDFIECGAGDIVTRLVQKNLGHDGNLGAFATARTGETVLEGLERVSRRFGTGQSGNPIALNNQAEGEDLSHDPNSEEAVPDEKAPSRVPIAIVAMGCVLPGASNPDQYWLNVKQGVSGIIDLTEVDPHARHDFMAGSVEAGLHIVPDKTYTLLNGSIVSIRYDEELLRSAYSEHEFNKLTRGQKLLALALGQGLSGEVFANLNKERVQCVLAATADGSSELDEALLVEGLQDEASNLNYATDGDNAGRRAAFSKVLEEILDHRRGDSHRLSQHRLYGDIVGRFVPGGVPTYIVDSACSSSLYAISVGVNLLVSGDVDVVLAGAVFAPGPANNTLFAQFRGLSPTGSRPLDKDADGVVFGDGAAVLVLKRLTDALAVGDKVLAVVRSVGLSSDGKSPSINVPQSDGQSLALRRAFQRSGVDLDTIQYVEAHATATPVGDRVELASLCDVFAGHEAGRIELGSVKSLIGHTGWVSGAASVIKVCQALAERIVPRQYNFDAADPELALDQSPFKISDRNHVWPDNNRGYPRRAGISGFGFGGTNAHLVLEEFRASYHRRLCDSGFPNHAPERLCVVGVGSLFPGVGCLAADRPTDQRTFARDALPLPPKKRLLPDVTEQMDPGQFLVSLAAEKIFSGLPSTWQTLRDETGVVLGLESKTERGRAVNKRIFLDRLIRLSRDAKLNSSIGRDEFERTVAALVTRVRQKQSPSGPYTLPGLMPNVAASRVCSLFDLKGPSMVIDMGENSLFQAIIVAGKLLAEGDCKLVLAGGVNVLDDADSSLSESAFLLGLMTEATARACGFPILAFLGTAARPPDSACPPKTVDGRRGFDYRGATGAVEILEALDVIAAGNSSYTLPEPSRTPGEPRGIVFSRVPDSQTTSKAPPPAAVGQLREMYAYVQDTPIYKYTPRLFVEPAKGTPASLSNRKLLFLTSQPGPWTALRRSGALDTLTYSLALPAPLNGDLGLAIDLRSEEGIVEAARTLAALDYDTVLAIRFAGEQDERPFLERDLAGEQALLELLFTVCKRDYDRISDRRVSVISLSIGPIEDGNLDPSTGLTSGFLKSLARELPSAGVVILNSDETDQRDALRQVEIELGAPESNGEVCYANGERHVFRLAAVEHLARDQQPYLDHKSVVLATGGGRGVTAVLAEELLERFGCTVVAVGRMDTSSVPDRLRVMDSGALAEHESQFYKDEIALDAGQKIGGLKRKFASYLAASEIVGTIHRLQRCAGRYEYHSADLIDPAAVDRIIGDIYRRFGRLDLVLHGAGVQISSMLTKKPLADFRRVIAAKLTSLRNIDRAISRHRGGQATHYHMLTSAFSYMGNDGQPDYGAANETLNRIAAHRRNSAAGHSHWSSMGWLGWAGIGMTRGSEFAALAAARRLRGVTREEGRKIFAEMMSGAPAAPVNILMADGEIAYYDVPVETARSPVRPSSTRVFRSRHDEQTIERHVTVESAPFLLDHMVNGSPTIPAAMMTCMVSEAARQLRPNLNIAAYENTHYRRFVKVSQEQGARIRIHARVTAEAAGEASVSVRILSDFIHKSGRLLQTDVVHNETVIRMTTSPPKPPPALFNAITVAGSRCPDPYVLPGSSVKLTGSFVSMRDILVDQDHRTATYKLRDNRYSDSEYGYLIPNMILVDAFWRFGTVQWIRDRTLGVYVPERCEVMRVFFDYTDFGAADLAETMTFRGTNPKTEGNILHVGPIEVTDSNNKVLLIVEGGVCRHYGEVQSPRREVNEVLGHVAI